MKYSKEYLLSIYTEDDFVFFWEHTPSKNGNLTHTCLSQWWKCKFTEDDISFCCAEQYMMYHKAILFGDSKHAAEILKANDPQNIKALGRLVNNFNDKVWNVHKKEIVLQGNILKFSQNPELKDYLLSTGNRILVEASPYDLVWGIGLKVGTDGICEPQRWKGQNLLGFLLMEVRDWIKANNQNDTV